VKHSFVAAPVNWFTPAARMFTPVRMRRSGGRPYGRTVKERSHYSLQVALDGFIIDQSWRATEGKRTSTADRRREMP
jgi:hypothetical protein